MHPPGPRAGRSALVLLLCAACSGMQRGAEVYPLDESWYGIDARPSPLPAGPAPEAERAAALATPVVDVHAHTFNARYLPIQNVLLGKRDVTLLGLFLYDGWARRIAAAITATASASCPLPDPDSEPTSLAGFEREVREQTGAGAKTVAEDECVQAIGRAAVRLQERTRSEPLAADDARRDERHLETREILEQELDQADLSRIRRALGLAGFALGGTVLEFLTRLVAKDSDLEAVYQRDFGNAVVLSVSQMMDLAPVYAQTEGAEEPLLPFEDQIRCMDGFQKRPDSRAIYFVAYNPFREHWPEPAEPGRALRIVTQALEGAGAYGVKLYPPSGYRPANNQIPCPPWALFTAEPRRQWKARYAGVTASELDRRLRELFAYCSSRQVPILAHCSTGELEARKGYGIAMSDPVWWEPVLEEFPKLRLCLGHAGGPDFWFGTSAEHEDWGRRVYKLCVTYENVYCEFGVHGQLAQPLLRESFIARLASLIESAAGPFPFESKILYGSDWFMPNGLAPASAFLLAYQEAFTDSRLIAHYRGFFHQNALRFLDLRRRLADPLLRLPIPVRERLARLVE